MAIEEPTPPSAKDFDLGDGIIDWEGGSEAWCRYRRQIDRYRLSVLLDSEEAVSRFQNIVRGIDSRWDAVMKRRNEPKRKAWQIEVIGDMPNN